MILVNLYLTLVYSLPCDSNLSNYGEPRSVTKLRSACALTSISIWIVIQLPLWVLICNVSVPHLYKLLSFVL
jgi:hypothetical protein